MDSDAQKAVIVKASRHLGRILDKAEVPESHGLWHAQKVLENL